MLGPYLISVFFILVGFENWPNIKAKGFQCGGRRQSPIDISRTNSKYRLLPKLRFCGFDVELENITASIVHGSGTKFQHATFTAVQQNYMR